MCSHIRIYRRFGELITSMSGIHRGRIFFLNIVQVLSDYTASATYTSNVTTNTPSLGVRVSTFLSIWKEIRSAYFNLQVFRQCLEILVEEFATYRVLQLTMTRPA
jgi:hypothetical protein